MPLNRSGVNPALYATKDYVDGIASETELHTHVVDEPDLTSAVQAKLALASSAVQPTRRVVAGAGVTGGGFLSGDVTVAADTSVMATRAYVTEQVGTAVTAYQKPVTGIPASDLAGAVQTSLGKADTAYQRPAAGIPASDLSVALMSAISGSEVGGVNVKSLGAVADGVTDDSAAFRAAITAAKNAVTTLPGGVSSDPVGTVVIDVPAGKYLITDPQAFFGDEAKTVKTRGVKWRGAGVGVTNIVFTPSAAAEMCKNSYWMWVGFEGISFHAGTTGCTFLQSYNSVNAAQRYMFLNCEFSYWKYVAELQGTNNNSEWCFINCHSRHGNIDGAFFYIGSSNTSDQFLNYWFYGCTHWSTSQPFIDAAKGGHFHIFGLDVSDWGTALTSTQQIFNLRGSTHANGVCTFEAQGVRVEAKNAYCALLYSEWQQGSVAFRSCDWSSQVGSYTYGNIITVSYTNYMGATYAFRDCVLAGGVEVKYATNEFQHVHKIVFDACTWAQKNSPSDVVTHTSTTGVNTVTKPPVIFRDCRGPSTLGNAYGSSGVAVWDAVVGWRGQPVQECRERELIVRHVYGLSYGSYTATIILPVGALITGVRVLAPAGGTTEADGGAWVLATTEGSPTTVCTVTVSGALKDGFDVTESLAVPFDCTSVARATLTLTPSNVTSYVSTGVLVIKGYW